MSRNYWKNFWAGKTDGDHRFMQEDFLKKEAAEKLFHLDGGNKLLDFGCGSADLLAYYSLTYAYCAGADFSEKMLQNATERLAKFNTLQKVQLFLTDDFGIWQVLENQLGKNYRFDRITAGQVMQYLTPQQIELFIEGALNFLSTSGTICLFDIVDSRTYELWKAGLFKGKSLNIRVIIQLIIGWGRSVKNKFKKQPVHGIGNIYPPVFFEVIAQRLQLKITVVHSMYYEYRYHVILSPESA